MTGPINAKSLVHQPEQYSTDITIRAFQELAERAGVGVTSEPALKSYIQGIEAGISIGDNNASLSLYEQRVFLTRQTKDPVTLTDGSLAQVSLDVNAALQIVNATIAKQ